MLNKWSNLTCFLIGLAKIKGAVSLVKVVTKGSLLAETNLAIEDFLNLPSELQNEKDNKNVSQLRFNSIPVSKKKKDERSG